MTGAAIARRLLGPLGARIRFPYHHRVDLALTRSTDLSTLSPRYSTHAVSLSLPFTVVLDGF